MSTVFFIHLISFIPLFFLVGCQQNAEIENESTLKQMKLMELEPPQVNYDDTEKNMSDCFKQRNSLFQLSEQLDSLD